MGFLNRYHGVLCLLLLLSSEETFFCVVWVGWGGGVVGRVFNTKIYTSECLLVVNLSSNVFHFLFLFSFDV